MLMVYVLLQTQKQGLDNGDQRFLLWSGFKESQTTAPNTLGVIKFCC